MHFSLTGLVHYFPYLDSINGYPISPGIRHITIQLKTVMKQKVYSGKTALLTSKPVDHEDL